MEQTISVGTVFSSAWAKTKGKMGFFILMTVVVTLILGIPSGISAALQEDHAGLSLLVNVIGWALDTWIGAGILAVALKVYNGEPVTLSELFKHHAVFWRYFWVGIMVGALLLAGLVLLIVPGIILALMFQFSTWYVVDQGLKPWEAMTHSMKAAKGIKGTLFLIGLALVGVNLLGALALGIGLFVTIPLTWMVMATTYKLADARL